MEFTGRLAVFPAANLLQWAANERASGVLVVRRTKREKRITLREGRVVLCRSNQPQELFGQHLIAHGLLDAPGVVEGLVRARALRVPLGAALVEAGRLPAEVVRAALERSVRESVQDLLLWKRGVFFFDEGEPPRLALEVELDPTDLMLEGIRWVDELARIRKVLVDDSVGLIRGAFWSLDGLSPYERRIAGQIHGEVTLGELYERTGGVQFPFLEAVRRLIERRVLAIARVGAGGEASSREIDLREVLLGLDGADDVVMTGERALLPIDVVHALVPVWIAPIPPAELDALAPNLRSFLAGFDGRTTLRRLLAPDDDTRADQMELLLVELRRRNVVLLPAALDDLDRRLGDASALRKFLRRLRG